MPENFKYYLLSFIAAFSLLGLFILTLVWLYSKKQQKNKKEKIKMQSEFQQALLQTQLEIQEQTFKTISQEIHDNIGQVLSLAKLNLNTLQLNESTKLSDTKNLVSKAITDLRNLSRSLHGDLITEIGLQQAIQNELIILQNCGNYKTSLQVSVTVQHINPQKQMVLFRMVQESISNIVKHAKATIINIKINSNENFTDLIIADDGIGFNQLELNKAKRGLGLTSMKSRATLIGATLNIESEIDNGTTIKIHLPNT